MDKIIWLSVKNLMKLLDLGTIYNFFAMILSQSLTNFFRYAGTVGCFIGSISGVGYLIRKVSHWQPMEDLIQSKMTRAQQKDLVSALLIVCAKQQMVSFGLNLNLKTNHHQLFHVLPR